METQISAKGATETSWSYSGSALFATKTRERKGSTKSVAEAQLGHRQLSTALSTRFHCTSPTLLVLLPGYCHLCHDCRQEKLGFLMYSGNYSFRKILTFAGDNGKCNKSTL